MNDHKPILGVTLYSFTNEWIRRQYNLEGLVHRVSELRLGPAVEVVGFQSLRTFPDVTDEFADHFRELLDRHRLIPSCLGANVDIGRRAGHLMTSQEMLAYIERQIISAKKLGFPVLRIQHFVGPAIFEKIAPLAEKAGVHVACELHAPLLVDHPDVIALRECYDRLDSPYIGFIPDLSSVMTSPPAIQWESLRSAGASEGLIEAAKRIWASDSPIPDKFTALAEARERFKADEAIAGQLNTTMTMFGHMPVEKLAELLPYTRHMHGKFYEVDASGQETSIPYPKVMALLKREGYQGTISAEWEGHAFTQEPIGFQQVQAWRAMCEKLLAGESV
jgi:sugar phosphate isomerase/epimerase